MAKRSSPSELNSRTIRVNIDDWRWINSLSLSLGVTVAEVFHKIVTGQGLKAEALVTGRVPHTNFRTTPTTAIATNGNKGIAVGIKPKGVKHA